MFGISEEDGAARGAMVTTTGYQLTHLKLVEVWDEQCSSHGSNMF